jgi:hypothetical protein
MAASGCGNSGLTDLGINHDKYLAEAYRDWDRE